MKIKFIPSKVLLPIVIAFSFVCIPFIASAQSTIIPCGFDLNADGKVLDTPTKVTATWAIGNHEECYFLDVMTLAQNVVNFLIFKIASPLAAVMFAYAGFLYVTNRGNESQVKQAHEIFLYVFWGLVVAIAAWVTVNYILQFFLGTGSGFNYLA